MAGLFTAGGNGMDDAGLASRADAVFGMFEENAFGDIGDIWAFFSDGMSDWAEEDAFTSFMADRGLPVEEAPVRASPIQSIADLAVAVRLETERLAALPRAPLPDRRALSVSAPIRRQGKKMSSTGGLFDAVAPSVPVLPVSVVPAPSTGSGPVFPAASLFVQTKPRGKAARVPAKLAPPKAVEYVVPAPSHRPPPAARPPVLPAATGPAPVPARKPSNKKAKIAPVAPPLSAGGGLFDLLSTLGTSGFVTEGTGALLSPPDSPLGAVSTSTPTAIESPSPVVSSSASPTPVVHVVQEVDTTPPPALVAKEDEPALDVLDTESFDVDVEVAEEESLEAVDEVVVVAPVAPAPGPVYVPVSVAPPSSVVRPTAPLPATSSLSASVPSAPALSGRPMPSRSRAAMVERAPAPYPAGDDDRVDFSQAIAPASRPAAKGWPSKRDPSVPRPSKPDAPQTVSVSRSAPAPSPVVPPAAAVPAGPSGETDIVDFFAEFDGLWDGDES